MKITNIVSESSKPSQARTTDPKPKKIRPTRGHESPHPLRGKLVGEEGNVSESPLVTTVGHKLDNVVRDMFGDFMSRNPTVEDIKALLKIMGKDLDIDGKRAVIDQLRKQGFEESDVFEADDPCWKNYRQIGMKTKGGKKVPNCVPKESAVKDRKDVAEGQYSDKMDADIAKLEAKPKLTKQEQMKLQTMKDYRDQRKKKSANLDEAAEKIACVACDAVSTKAAWQKNKNFCPKCKKSNKGVAESAKRSSLSEVTAADSEKAFELKKQAAAHKKTMLKHEKMSGPEAHERFLKSKTAFTNAMKKLKQLDLPKPELDALRKGTHLSESASPMIADPERNVFNDKQAALAYKKEHGGKVMRREFTNPRTGETTTSYKVVRENVAENDDQDINMIAKMVHDLGTQHGKQNRALGSPAISFMKKWSHLDEDSLEYLAEIYEKARLASMDRQQDDAEAWREKSQARGQGRRYHEPS
jgi:hypothetical protein